MGGAASALSGIHASMPDRVGVDEIISAFGKDHVNDKKWQLFKDADEKIDKGVTLRLATSKYDVFLTFDWTIQSSSTRMYDKMVKIQSELEKHGFRVWFSKEQNHQNMVKHHFDHIDSCLCAVLFINKSYLEKIADNAPATACKAEFDYMVKTKGKHLLIPILLDSDILTTSKVHKSIFHVIFDGSKATSASGQQGQQQVAAASAATSPYLDIHQLDSKESKFSDQVQDRIVQIIKRPMTKRASSCDPAAAGASSLPAKPPQLRPEDHPPLPAEDRDGEDRADERKEKEDEEADDAEEEEQQGGAEEDAANTAADQQATTQQPAEEQLAAATSNEGGQGGGLLHLRRNTVIEFKTMLSVADDYGRLYNRLQCGLTADWETCQSYAAQGDKLASGLIMKCLWHGWYRSERDPGKANEIAKQLQLWLKSTTYYATDAAHTRHVIYSHWLLGSMQLEGVGGIGVDKREAFLLFQQAVKEGCLVANLQLGRCYEHGEGTETNMVEAIACYHLAATRFSLEAGQTEQQEEAGRPGFAQAQYQLGCMYRDGKGTIAGTVTEDIDMLDEAVAWFTKASEQGYPAAHNALGLIYNEQPYFDSDMSKRYFLLAKEQGYVPGYVNLALWLEVWGNTDQAASVAGTGLDKQEARQLLQYAAERLDAEGQYHLGRFLENGIGGKEDKHEALLYYKLASDQGDVNAKASYEQLKRSSHNHGHR